MTDNSNRVVGKFHVCSMDDWKIIVATAEKLKQAMEGE